jgi:predicted DNA-binding transcriptional regulator AlpA
MSPRRTRGACSAPGCTEPSRARRRCWGHYRKWRRSIPDDRLENLPAAALTAAQVAALLGITTDTLTRQVSAGKHLPDGRTQGRNWWLPTTVASWDLQLPPPDALSAREVAALLGLTTSRVHALATSGELPPGGHVGGRRVRWWHRETIEDYERKQPGDVLWTTDVAALLGVSRETVRRLAQTTLPADGTHRGRRWWSPGRVDVNPPPSGLEET